MKVLNVEDSDMNDVEVELQASIRDTEFIEETNRKHAHDDVLPPPSAMKEKKSIIEKTQKHT